MTEKCVINLGDTVLHKPSGERWVVLYADYQTGYLAAAGWPYSETPIDQCELIEAEKNTAWLLKDLPTSAHPAADKALRLYALNARSTDRKSDVAGPIA